MDAAPWPEPGLCLAAALTGSVAEDERCGRAAVPPAGAESSILLLPSRLEPGLQPCSDCILAKRRLVGTLMVEVVCFASTSSMTPVSASHALEAALTRSACHGRTQRERDSQLQCRVQQHIFLLFNGGNRSCKNQQSSCLEVSSPSRFEQIESEDLHHDSNRTRGKPQREEAPKTLTDVSCSASTSTHCKPDCCCFATVASVWSKSGVGR